jgi:hypothetical protein
MKEFERKPMEQWQKPNLEREFGEIDRTAKEFSKGNKELYDKIMWAFKNQFEFARLEELTDEVWAQLENTDSYHDISGGEVDKLSEIAAKNKRAWKRKSDDMKKGVPMAAPIIFQMGNRYHKVAGNTRLMIARVLGIRPKVVFIKLPE